MTEHQTAVFAAKMHAVAFAEVEGFAVLAWFKFAHPTAVAIGFEAVLPDLPERVFVDVALIVFAANTGAGGYTAVDEDGGHAQSGCTLVQMVTHLAFVSAQVTLAGV